MKTLNLTLLVMTLVSVTAFATDLKGNEVVDQGSYGELQGTLYSEDGEYYLDTGYDVYAIHLGPDWYATEIGFPPESTGYAEVKGMVHSLDSAPSTITLAGEVFSFRGEDGFPLWAGRGNRQNQATGNGYGTGKGRNAGINRK